MDEKVLLDWKEVHADIYSKFKQDWEAQLQKPCHETILELGDNEDADSLQQAMASLASVTSQGNFDIEQLYAKAVEQKDEAAYCLCCYLVFDDGAEQLAKAFKEKAKESGTKTITDALSDYIRFRKQNQQQETAEVTTNELNILTLRRWHYDHPEEYAEFLSLFQKAYEGDMTFIQNNFFFLIESLNFTGVKGMMAVAASLFPGNNHYVQRLTSSEGNPLKGRFAELLESTINNEAIRERMLRKNPYLFSLYYWLVFDDGFLHAADLISHTFLQDNAPAWQKMVGSQAVEALISTSVDKAHYTKAQWQEVSRKIKKGEARQVVKAALLDVQGRRGRKATYVILEEMLPKEHVAVLTAEIHKVLSEWKQYDDTDSVLAYIFAALVEGGIADGEYNYRTFHAAMREKFPDYNISKGFDWAEAVYNAIMPNNDDSNLNVSENHIVRGRRYARDIRLRLQLAINPKIS
jgi:hypothetical protein